MARAAAPDRLTSGKNSADGGWTAAVTASHDSILTLRLMMNHFVARNTKMETEIVSLLAGFVSDRPPVTHRVGIKICVHSAPSLQDEYSLPIPEG
ncbi:MAG: hypothetical protein BRD55_12060 [Bacteroidetes bacterium SW_9_63_38]|nr:MAG: hypothetical protein BRD55_12060 [Bacteroidetes bacterium SW_9_63_38]